MALRVSLLHSAAVGSACLVLTACTGSMGSRGPGAVAELEPTRGSFVTGTATFVQRGDKVIVTADIRGLPAGAVVGFHIHDKGDCSSGDGMSAGGHFNPLKKPHGHEGAERHVGDMPNLTADATGRALYRAELDLMTVSDGPTSIVGHGLIVHRDIDDYTTQPTGNAGPRLACGVIRRTS